jgi:hypothetical protein
MEKVVFDNVVRGYLDFSKKEEEAEIFALLNQYLAHLSLDSEEDILLEDFTAFEADDFINFFLDDNFEIDEATRLKTKSEIILKKFFNYILKNKYISKEEALEWKEVFG